MMNSNNNVILIVDRVLYPFCCIRCSLLFIGKRNSLTMLLRVAGIKYSLVELIGCNLYLDFIDDKYIVCF